MVDLSPAALVIAKAVLAADYHPSKLGRAEPYVAAAQALHDAGLLRETQDAPPRQDAHHAQQNQPQHRATMPAVDDPTWEQLWPELTTTDPVLTLTITALAQAVYALASEVVDLDGQDALRTLREALTVRGVPPAAATRVGADMVTLHASLASGSHDPTNPA